MGSRAPNEWGRYGCGKRQQKGWAWPYSEPDPILLELPRSPPTMGHSELTKPFILSAEPAEDPALTPGTASRGQRRGPFKT